MTMDKEFLARLDHPAHRQLYSHWCAQADPQRLPGRQDLDLTSMRDLLPWIGEIEVTRAESRLQFRYRQTGKAIVKARGGDPSGRLFEELHQGVELTMIRLTHIQIVAKKRPKLIEV